MPTGFLNPETLALPVTIYGLRCPDSGIIRYVGKAVDVSFRFYQHTHWNKNEDTKKARWIKKLATQGKTPEVVVLETTTNKEWKKRERWWIAHFRALGIDLTNTTDGGDGGPYGFKQSEETRKKKSEIRKGKHLSEETRRKISAAHTGKQLPAWRVEKNRQAQLARVAKMTKEEKLQLAARMKKNEDLRKIRQREALQPGMMKKRKAKSKYYGVVWFKPRNRWKVRVRINGKEKCLGSFKNEEDAAMAYNALAPQYLGDKIRLN